MENPTSIELYQKLLDIPKPWGVVKVEQDRTNKTITVFIKYRDEGKGVPCPQCGSMSAIHDHRTRRLRHLDTCIFQTILEVEVPRAQCTEHEIQQLPLSFAEKNSRYTVLFEALVVDRLREAPISAVAENCGLGWDATDGIMQRAIERGLERRKEVEVKELGIDETSYRKGHEYVTVLQDKGRDCVMEVLDGHGSEVVRGWFQGQSAWFLSKVASISMDMREPYIKAVREVFERWEALIGFDRFHGMKKFNEAVDKVRRGEHAEFNRLTGDSPLSKTRFAWLTNSNRTDNRRGKRKVFLELMRQNLRTARAWRIKELAGSLWDYVYMNVAESAWRKLLWWISHSRIPEMIKVGKTIRTYFWGILNAIRQKTSNGMLEAKNSRIQSIKKMASGFRNKDRLKRAILFHLGNLDMSPATI
jgi:transposase